MSKKKAIICTIFFAIILIGLVFGSIMIKNMDGISLYTLISSYACWFLVYERIIKFYKWLIKG